MHALSERPFADLDEVRTLEITTIRDVNLEPIQPFLANRLTVCETRIMPARGRYAAS